MEKNREPGSRLAVNCRRFLGFRRRFSESQVISGHYPTLLTTITNYSINIFWCKSRMSFNKVFWSMFCRSIPLPIFSGSDFFQIRIRFLSGSGSRWLIYIYIIFYQSIVFFRPFQIVVNTRGIGTELSRFMTLQVTRHPAFPTSRRFLHHSFPFSSTSLNLTWFPSPQSEKLKFTPQ